MSRGFRPGIHLPREGNDNLVGEGGRRGRVGEGGSGVSPLTLLDDGSLISKVAVALSKHSSLPVNSSAEVES